MFDFGFSELVVIAVVTLIVVGPERLPKVARTAGHLLGRLQRYVSDVKSDIQREMQLEELKKLQQQVEQQARELESSVRGQVAKVESEVDSTVADVKSQLAPQPDAPVADAPPVPVEPTPDASQAVARALPGETAPTPETEAGAQLQLSLDPVAIPSRPVEKA